MPAMNGYNTRVGKGTCSPPGTPTSPTRCRRGKVGKVAAATRTNVTERFVFLLIAAVFRRKGILLFAPLLYISGMLMYMGTLSLDVVPEGMGVAILRRMAPGSVYRSPKVFEKLWPYMQMDGDSTSLAGGFWFDGYKSD